MDTVRIRDRSDFSARQLDDLGRWLADQFEDEYRPETWTDIAPGPHLLLDDALGLVAHACLTPVPVTVDERPLRSSYVELVATRADARGRGHGSTVMRAAAPLIEAEAELGLLSTGAHGFYERLGWVRWSGPTSVLEADGTVTPTPEEDDGIMALFVARTPESMSTDAPIRRPRRDPIEAW